MTVFLVFLAVWFFPQVFGQVNDWPILEVYEMITVLHVVASPIVFIYFMVGIGRKECLKL